LNPPRPILPTDYRVATPEEDADNARRFAAVKGSSSLGRPLRPNRLADDVRELHDRFVEFSGRASAEEIRTLLRILRRWPEMRAVTKDALFASVAAECGRTWM
jgi:hypothetical protein